MKRGKGGAMDKKVYLSIIAAIATAAAVWMLAQLVVPIRPLAIGAKSDIPTLAVVLGAVTGVFALGIIGLILGPVIFAILFTVWQDVTQSGSS